MSKNPPHYFPPEAERGMFMILPLKYDEETDLDTVANTLPAGRHERDYSSDDFIQMMNKKCAGDGNFVRRIELDKRIDSFLLPNQAEDSTDADTLECTNYQIFIFDKGIAFVTAYIDYTNATVENVYNFVQPGYNDSAMDSVRKQFIDNLERLVNISKPNSVLSWFTDYTPISTVENNSDENRHESEEEKNARIKEAEHATYLRRCELQVKEAFRMNVAYSLTRFASAKATHQGTYNEHRIIDLTRPFADPSEHDVQYFSGAKDVNDEHYGWGCSVTSQEVSYVYAKKKTNPKPLVDRANDDLLLLMLALYQKYESMSINEKIHERRSENTQTKKSIYALKQEAMNLIAYETLAPSQISRWNNVCEIYKATLDLTGVDETIAEVKDKIEMLTAEQDRLDGKRDTAISTVITVFGLVSIIAAILQTVDYLDSRSPVMWVSFFGSLAAVLVLGIYLGIRLGRKKG